MPLKIKWQFFVFFFLQFFGRFPGILGIELGLVGYYIYTFTVYSIVLLVLSTDCSLHIWLIVSTFFIVFSALVGLMHGWYTKDVLADVSRFIAPLIGFALSIRLFKFLNLREIFFIFQLLIFYSLFSFFQSVWIKFNLVQNGIEPLILYGGHGGHGFRIDYLSLSVLLFLAACKRLNIFAVLTTVIYFLGAWISPFLNQSKAEMVGIASITLLLFLTSFSLPKKVIIVFCILLIALCSINFIQPSNISNRFIRFEEFFETVISGDFNSGKDKSTGTRVIEIITAIDDQLNEGVSGVIFGLGSGALWFPKSINMDRILLGLPPANFRPSGGVHHIHTTPIAVLFRYGLIGFCIYFFWLLSITLRFRKRNSLPIETHALNNAFRTFVLLCIILSFPLTSIYGSLSLGLTFGLLIHISAKLPIKQNIEALTKPKQLALWYK